jgi:hypothetical protein
MERKCAFVRTESLVEISLESYSTLFIFIPSIQSMPCAHIFIPFTETLTVQMCVRMINAILFSFTRFNPLHTHEQWR